MAGDLHEHVIKGFERQITRQLDIIEQSNDQVAADFARGIKSRGSPKIATGEGGFHYPDASFTHRDTEALSVIVEVSHSEESKDLPFLADEYILGSNGQTQIVIGIDIECRRNKGKEAKVMVWRPRFAEEDGEIPLEAAETETGIFRAMDGSLVDGERILRIGLRDFGYWPNCPRIDDIPGEITISFSQLYEMVLEGEAAVENMDRGRRKLQQENYKKRKRVRPPPEQIGSGSSDGDRFKAAEEKIDKKQYDPEGGVVVNARRNSEVPARLRPRLPPGAL